MSKDEERIKRVFPKYFENFILPDGAKEEVINVYRACRTNKCDRKSFIPSYEENGYKVLGDSSNPSEYSLSAFEEPKHVKRFAITNPEVRKPLKIAKGITDPSCGLVQRTKDRVPKTKSSHVDWWLYENAKPHMFFELIDNFAEFWEEYNMR